MKSSVGMWQIVWEVEAWLMLIYAYYGSVIVVFAAAIAGAYAMTQWRKAIINDQQA